MAKISKSLSPVGSCWTRHISHYQAGPAVVLTLLAVVALMPYRNFAGDDAFISFRFAENFRDGAGFSFNPHDSTYGSTAPLWVFMISAFSKMGFDVPLSAHILNWFCVIVLVPLFLALSSSYLGRGPAAWVATALLILDPWFIRWAVSGLENAFTLLLLVGVFLSQKTSRNSGKVNWLAPSLAALAGLCRPEMLLLCILLAADTVLLERKRRIADLTITFGIYCAVFFPWFAYAYRSFGTVIPNTVTAKISSDYLLTIERIFQYFGSFWIFQAISVLAVIAISPLRRAAIALFRDSWNSWLLPVAWGIALPLFYIAGGAPVAGRYMMFGLPSYLLVGVGAWTVIWQRHPKLIIAAAVATIALVVAVQAKFSWYTTHWPRGMDPAMIEAAEYLKDNSNDQDIVAANQIGALGYFSHRRVLDTFGLVSPEVFPYLEMGSTALWTYICERKVNYLFLSDTIDELKSAYPGFGQLETLRTFHVRREGASAASATRIYYLYRTNWHGDC